MHFSHYRVWWLLPPHLTVPERRVGFIAAAENYSVCIDTKWGGLYEWGERPWQTAIGSGDDAMVPIHGAIMPNKMWFEPEMAYRMGRLRELAFVGRLSTHVS